MWFYIESTACYIESVIFLINKDDKLPLYIQVKNDLIAKINNHVYKVGDKLPTEDELESIFGVSRITIRRTISDMEEDGYLLKKQGKGTFVIENQVKRNLLTLNGYSDFMSSINQKPKRKIIKVITYEKDEWISEQLKLDNEATYTVLSRVLKLADGNFGYEINYYPKVYFPEIEKFISDNRSTTDLLSTRYHCSVKNSKKIINMSFANTEIANYLNVLKGEPLFKVDKINYDVNEKPVFVSVMYYVGAKTTFVV